MSKYEPKFARVLIEREVKEKIGSIILPDNQQKRHASCIGRIVALGETAGWLTCYDDNGEQFNKRVLEPGQKVIFGRYAGTWLDDGAYDAKGEITDNARLFLCQDEDILVVVKEQV